MHLNSSFPAAPVTSRESQSTNRYALFTVPTRYSSLTSSLPNLIQLPRRSQQIQLCLLPLEIRIQKSHPFIILFQPRSLHLAQVHFALAELLLHHGNVLLR